jgi:hypothetical protein
MTKFVQRASGWCVAVSWAACKREDQTGQDDHIGQRECGSGTALEHWRLPSLDVVGSVFLVMHEAIFVPFIIDFAVSCEGIPFVGKEMSAMFLVRIMCHNWK